MSVYFEDPRGAYAVNVNRVVRAFCTFRGCRREFRGVNPQPCLDRHMAEHRAESVRAVAGS